MSDNDDDDGVLVMNFWDDVEDFPAPIKSENCLDNSPDQSFDADPLASVKIEDDHLIDEDTKEIFKDFDHSAPTPYDGYMLGAEAEYILGADTPDLAISRDNRVNNETVEAPDQPVEDTIILDSDSEDDSTTINDSAVTSIIQNMMFNDNHSDKTYGGTILHEENSTIDKKTDVSSIIITNVESVVEVSKNISDLQAQKSTKCGTSNTDKSNLIHDNKDVSNSIVGETQGETKYMFRCEFCPFFAKTRFSLSRHILLHINENIGDEHNQDTTTATETGHSTLEFKEGPLTTKNLKTSSLEITALKTTDPDNRKTKIFKCKACSFTSKIRFALKRHTLLTHKGLARNMCNCCNFISKSKAGLVNHIRLLHKTDKSRSRPKKTDKSYVCKKCGFKTLHKASYLGHVKTNKNRLRCLGPGRPVAKKKVKKETKNTFKTDLIDVEESMATSQTSNKRILVTRTSGEKVKINIGCNKMHLGERNKEVREIKNTDKLVLSEVKSKGTPSDLSQNYSDAAQSTIRKYQCKYCSFSSIHDPVCRRHVVLHTRYNKPIYNCQKCTFKSTRQALAKHVISAHPEISKGDVKTDLNESIKEEKVIKVSTKLDLNEANGYKIKIDNTNLRVDFDCPYCSHSSKSKVFYKYHSVLHTKNKKPVFHCKTRNYRSTNTALIRLINSVHKGREIKNGNKDETKMQLTDQNGWSEDAKKQAYVTSNTSDNEVKFSDGIQKLVLQERSQSSDKTKNLRLSFESNTFYVCEICDYMTHQKRTLINHKFSHSSSTLSETKIESLDLKCKTENTEQIADKEKQESERKSFGTRTADDQKRISLLLKNGNRQCSQCERRFTSQHGFVRHVCENEHEFRKLVSYEGLGFTCNLCRFNTTTISGIRSHLLVHKRLKEAAINKCSDCGFQTKHKISLYRHLKRCPSKLISKRAPIKMKYSCNMCSFKTNRVGAIKGHKMKTHRELLTCDLCEYKTLFPAVLSRHKKYIHKLFDHEEKKLAETSTEVTYKCDDCDFKTNYKHNLQNHKVLHININELRVYKNKTYNFKIKKGKIQKSHDRTETCGSTDNKQSVRNSSNTSANPHKFSCGVCPFSTTIRSSYYHHRWVHKSKEEGKVYKCDLCTYKTDMSYYLTTHKKRNHNKSQIYKCSICSYSTTMRENLEQHMATMHNNLKEEVVWKKTQLDNSRENTKSNVKLETTNKSKLQVLANFSESRIQFGCQYCDYKTTIRFKLKKHIEKMHSESKDIYLFKCNFCSYTSNHKGNFQRHIQRHSDNPKEETPKVREFKKPTLFKCNSCFYSTKHKHSLYYHFNSCHVEK